MVKDRLKNTAAGADLQAREAGAPGRTLKRAAGWLLILEVLLGGAIIGLAQWLALRSLYGVRPVWVLNTAVGLALGLTVGVALFGTATDTLNLLARGFITGLGVGAAQAFALRALLLPLWTLVVALLWALAWPATGLVIDASLGNDYAVFGASGALFFTLMSGVALLAPRRTRV